MKTTFTLLIFSFFTLTINAQMWEQLGNAPFLKHHSNGFGVNGKAYIFQGTNNESVSNIFWEYEPSTDEWTRIDPFTGPGRSFAIGDDLDGKYYYGFGNGISGQLNDLWVFDPADMSFTELASCPCVGRTHPAFIAHNGKIHMGSGSTSMGDLNDWWEYDIATDTWTEKPVIPGPVRHHPFQFNIDDIIYVGGGHVDNWLSYDPVSTEWNFIDDLPAGRVAGTQFSHDGYGYVLAGDDAGHVSLDAEISFMRYDAATDEWELLPAPPNGTRWAPSSFIINDELYFFGGMFGPVSNDRSVWKLDLNALNGMTSSTEEQVINGAIEVYPNPVKNFLNINSDIEWSIDAVANVYNVSGKMVYTGTLAGNEINVSNLSGGTYVLMIRSNSKIYRSTFNKLD